MTSRITDRHPACPAPLCTTCAHPADHVYTTYTSRSNIRLGVCPRCNAFIDPLIEAPTLLLALDLVLLKPRVFLHLLFNRGSPPRRAGDTKQSESSLPSPASTGAGGSSSPEPPASSASPASGMNAPSTGYDRRARVRSDLARLALATVVAETAVRLMPLLPVPWSAVATTLGRVSCELAAQLAASTLLALGVLRLRAWYPLPKALTAPPAIRDGRQEAFLPELIPLVLLYTALLPLLLQLALGIWRSGDHLLSTPSTAPSLFAATSPSSLLATLPLPIRIPPAWTQALYDTETLAEHAWATGDRVWAGTRLLGGMSAGFGLRVLLPTRPWETTAIVLVGWMAALYASWAVTAVCGG